MRNTFIDTVIEASMTRENIFVITGDAGLGVFDDFKRDHPDRYLNLGIAEQNMISFAAGLAMNDYKVYIYNITPFLLYRCYEQVRNDICYQRLPIVLVGIGSGVTYSPAGITHYSVEDIGLAQTLPNLKVFSPADPAEARATASYSLTSVGPVFVRLAKKGEPVINNDQAIDIELPQKIADGKDVALVFHGSISEEVIKAQKLLVAKGISPLLISVPMVQPLNTEKLIKMLKGIKYVVTVEEHFVNLGLGGIILREFFKAGHFCRLLSLGIPSIFIHEIKDFNGLRDHYGISGRKIADSVIGLMNNKIEEGK